MAYLEITTNNMTARQAAEHFAAIALGEPRKVGLVNLLPGDSPAMGKGCQFQLVDGLKWYRVEMMPKHAGWVVSDEAGREANSDLVGR